MFDVGFWELVLIFIIGLIFVGPERLPEIASEAGKFISKTKRFINNARRELEQELALKNNTSYRDSLADSDSLMNNAPDKHGMPTKKNE